MRHPRTSCNVLIRCLDLFFIVTRQQTHEQVGINRAHGGVACAMPCFNFFNVLASPVEAPLGKSAS